MSFIRGGILNKLERLVYNIVRDNPKLKNKIKQIYQKTLTTILPIKKSETNFNINCRKGYFFGFHDKIPWSSSNEMLLSHKYEIPSREPKAQKKMKIGYFREDKFNELTSTLAWNWKQGSMLQWVGDQDKIIFNDYENKSYISRIININGDELRKIDKPIGAVSPNGKFALSYNFPRLRRGMWNGNPGYGYLYNEDPDSDKLIPDTSSSSLHLVNLNTSSTNELFTVKEIANYKPKKSMEGAFHFFTHCLFSPSGDRFVFFHRWLVNDNKLWTRMISSDLKGEDIHVFPTSDMVSHIGWKDENHIVAYAATKDRGDNYYLFKDQSKEYEIIGENCFNSDGHPQISPNGKYMLSDMYPDRKRRQTLIIYDLEKEIRYDIAKFYLPWKFSGELKVDLHPRWDRTGTKVCFDAAFDGEISLCTIDLGDKLDKLDKYCISKYKNK